MEKDYYLILRVSPNASLDELRSAYRQRALELHPDTSGSDSGPFLELQEAYAALTKRSKQPSWPTRADTATGRTPKVRRAQRAEPMRAVEPAGGFRELSISRDFGSYGPSRQELFDRLWRNFDLRSRPKGEHLESLTVEVPLDGDLAVEGGTIRLMVPVRGSCPLCHGHGAVGLFECWSCAGQGWVTVERPVHLSIPAGLRRDYVVRVPLHRFGIGNFYLTVRLRPTQMQD